MENSQEKKMFEVAEIQLTYKTNVSPSLRPKIASSKDAYHVLFETWDSSKIEFVEQFEVILLNRAQKVLGICENPLPVRSIFNKPLARPDHNKSGYLVVPDAPNSIIYDESLTPVTHTKDIAFKDQVQLFRNKDIIRTLIYETHDIPDYTRKDTITVSMEGRDTIIVTDAPVDRAWFSKGGDTLCTIVTYPHGYGIILYNLELKRIFNISVSAMDQITENIENDFIFESPHDSIYQLNFKSHKLKGLDMFDPASISNWIDKNKIFNAFEKDLGPQRIQKAKEENSMSGWKILLNDVLGSGKSSKDDKTINRK